MKRRVSKHMGKAAPTAQVMSAAEVLRWESACRFIAISPRLFHVGRLTRSSRILIYRRWLLFPAGGFRTVDEGSGPPGQTGTCRWEAESGSPDGFPIRCEGDSVAEGLILRQVFRNSENTNLATKLDLVRGIGRDPDGARLGPEPCDHVANGATLELRDHKCPVFRVFPDPQLVDGMAKHLFPRIAVTLLEGSVYVQEPAFRERGDGKRDRARTEYSLELLFRDPASFLGFEESRLDLAEILSLSFQFFPVNRSAFI